MCIHFSILGSDEMKSSLFFCCELQLALNLVLCDCVSKVWSLGQVRDRIQNRWHKATPRAQHVLNSSPLQRTAIKLFLICRVANIEIQLGPCLTISPHLGFILSFIAFYQPVCISLSLFSVSFSFCYFRFYIFYSFSICFSALSYFLISCILLLFSFFCLSFNFYFFGSYFSLIFVSHFLVVSSRKIFAHFPSFCHFNPLSFLKEKCRPMRSLPCV